MPRKISTKPPPQLRFPNAGAGIAGWLVLALDPSLSRTGYAFLLVTVKDQKTKTLWLEVGSLKPEDASEPVWARSKAIALALRERLEYYAGAIGDPHPLGLILSFEAPTPRNDFLTSLSRILHVVLLEDSVNCVAHYSQTYIEMTNAATLRSLMGLTQRGAKNKLENVARAYSFLDQAVWPNLDTDACDAVLMAMMGRYSAAVLLGHPEDVPDRFLATLCSADEEKVGKGRRAHTRTKGILHRPEYWTRYVRKPYALLLRDARVKKSRLERLHFTL